MGSEGARLDAWASKFWEARITGVDKEEQLIKSSNKKTRKSKQQKVKTRKSNSLRAVQLH